MCVYAGGAARSRHAVCGSGRPAVAMNAWGAATEKMCKVTVVEPNGKTRSIEVAADANLRKALKDAKFDMYTLAGKMRNCGGNGACGTCIVDVTENEMALTPRTMKEEVLLQGKPPSWRLACRATIQDGVTVRLKPQAQKTTQF